MGFILLRRLLKRLLKRFFGRFTPSLRYVLPDEVAKSLGQGQGRGTQVSACFKKSLHLFLCFPFFIFVFEPLVFRLLFLPASVIFSRSYLLSTSLVKITKFHHSFPLILCFLHFELFIVLFSFQLPPYNSQMFIFVYNLPSNAMVLISLLGSFLIEMIKERKAIHKLVYPNHQSSMEFEDRLGMPPSYMVVEMSWDEEDEDTEKVELTNAISTISGAKSYSIFHNCDLLKTHRRLSTSRQVRLPAQPAPLLRLAWLGGRHSLPDMYGTVVSTENYEEICRLLRSNFNIFVVTSAVGVAVCLALKNTNLNLKHLTHQTLMPSNMHALRSTAA